ncbi:hypothetical protein HPB50_008731 [Hyalomma asiaticum]|uniref:Uncharacterized protein n=1 Tax=Hyalomma asiaticum TaxID=266040 RepID=A0ACB7SCK0_HYAAI|nr:hypothetical protein HPB50_008731 [Hyalomma asiaticum]
MVDPFSFPSQTGGTLGVQMPSTFATLGHPRHRWFLAAAVLLATVTFVVVTVSLSLLLTRRLSRLRRATVPGEQAFCCPEDAREMSSVVNASISPCRDFNGRVCNTVIEFRLWKRATQQAELERIMITGFFPSGAHKGEAGRFLTAYYKSCVETLPRRQSFVRGLAAALTRATRQLLTTPDSRNAFLYAMLVPLKYGIASVFDVEFNPSGSYLAMRVILRCEAGSDYPDIVDASVDALADVANVSVTPQEVHELTARVCSRIAAMPVRAFFSKQYRFASDDADAFNQTVWDVTDLRFALRTLGYLVNSETSILVHHVQEVRAIFDVYGARGGGGHLGGKAALLLSQSVEDGMWQFYDTPNGSWPGVFDVCTQSVRLIGNIWAKFVAELKGHPGKLDRMRAIFKRVKDAVHRDVSSSPVFEAEEAQNVAHFFDDVSLETPWTDAGLLAVAVPEPTHVFTEDLLKARAYNFQVYRARFRISGGDRPIDRLFYVGHRYMFLSAAMCDFVRVGSGPSSEIPNMAVLGMLVAESIWRMVLSDQEWTLSTRSSIRRLFKCYVDNYGNDTNNWSYLTSVSRTLGLTSVLNAFDRSDWNTLRAAWSLLSMSHGELFYSLVAYYRCPYEATADVMRTANAPFAFSEDFARVFHCGSDSPMVKPQRCIVRAPSRT